MMTMTTKLLVLATLLTTVTVAAQVTTSDVTTSEYNGVVTKTWYSWEPSAWTSCSKSCLGGTRTRSAATCLRYTQYNEAPAASLPQDESTCVAASPSLDTSVVFAQTDVCNTNACGYALTSDALVVEWVVPNYGPCSVSCDFGAGTREGVKTRDVECRTTELSMTPGSTATVTTHYWPILPIPCTDMMSSRAATSATCSVSCDVGGKPQVAVIATIPLNTLQWGTRDWSVCSATCGGGTRTREVACKSTLTTVHPSTGVETDTVMWWGEVEGVESTCTQNGVSETFRPTLTSTSASEACNTDACATFVGVSTSYAWTTPGDWSSCSATCGSGTRTRELTCTQTLATSTSTTTSVVMTNACLAFLSSTVETPSASEACNTDACATTTTTTTTTTSLPSYAWTAGDWSSCSATCGSGVRTRTPSCVETTATTTTNVEIGPCMSMSFLSIVGDSATIPVPSSREACNTDACVTVTVTVVGPDVLGAPDLSIPTTSYAWTTGDWASCSSTCGSGTRTRELTCTETLVSATGVTTTTSGVMSNACVILAVGETPSASESCNTNACPGGPDMTTTETTTETAAELDGYLLVALINTKKVVASMYSVGFPTDRWNEETIVPCGSPAFLALGSGSSLLVRVTMGANVDYFKPTASLCDMLTAVGQWYFHSSSASGPWKAVNGNHSALLGGFQPYGADTRVWGPFWGAPDGAEGYHAEGGGCCHVDGDAAAIQFWRSFTIHVRAL
jgi:hypothetical protein